MGCGCGGLMKDCYCADDAYPTLKKEGLLRDDVIKNAGLYLTSEQWTELNTEIKNLKSQVDSAEEHLNRMHKALEDIASFYIAEHRQNEWSELCKLKEIAKNGLSRTTKLNRHCKKCNSPRHTDICQKCGEATLIPVEGWESPQLPPIDRIRELAKEVGYAIGVHGSMERDLDLIAAPWTEEAIGNYGLMQHIAKGLGAVIIEMERKPKGRYAATIQMNGWFKNIDLSVCPGNSHTEAAKYKEALELIESNPRTSPMTKIFCRSALKTELPCSTCKGEGKVNMHHAGDECPKCDGSGKEHA